MHRVRDTADYWCEIEEHRRGEDQFLLCHIRFNKCTPSVMKQFLREWECFRRCVPAPLFATAEVEDEKWVRFVTRLGFKPLREVVCRNGARRTLYLNQKDRPDARGSTAV
jgi:hypothetical protein